MANANNLRCQLQTVCRLLFYAGSSPSVELTHVWTDSADGLLINSTFVLGTRNAKAAAWLNPALLEEWRTGKLEAWTLHNVEEFGNFEYFLQDAYVRYARR